MSTFQRYVLRMLARTQTGALHFGGDWIFPDDVRNNRRLAEALYWAFVREMD